MLCVQHPNVLRIHNMIEDTVFNHRRWIMLVLELAPKKEIFDFIGVLCHPFCVSLHLHLPYCSKC